MKFYFFSYAWRLAGGQWNFAEKITNQHPIQYSLDARERGATENEQHSLLFWSEITDEQARQWENEVG